MNPGLAVVKDGNPPLTGYRFRRSSDLIEWSAWPAREVVTRIDFVFSIWKNPNRGDVFLLSCKKTAHVPCVFANERSMNTLSTHASSVSLL